MSRRASNRRPQTALQASFADAAALDSVRTDITEAEMEENRRRAGLPDNWMDLPLRFGPGNFDADSFMQCLVTTLNAERRPDAQLVINQAPPAETSQQPPPKFEFADHGIQVVHNRAVAKLAMPLTPAKVLADMPFIKPMHQLCVQHWSSENEKLAFGMVDTTSDTLICIALLHRTDENPVSNRRQPPWILDFITTKPEYRRQQAATTVLKHAQSILDDIHAFSSNDGADKTLTGCGFRAMRLPNLPMDVHVWESKNVTKANLRKK
jgi:hypothetical protein